MIPGSGSKGHKTPSVIANRYRVERELGRGGMATVYLCTDTKTSQPVAVKVLRPELGSAVVVERFLREIAFASELDHPRIPKVLDSGVMGELPFYVMTYIDGESLRALLDREKQLPVDKTILILSAVIEPMEYAHQRGIVHRDVKPGNILLAGGEVYVLDFGIARAILASADESLTSTGVAVGTPAYMSPEQALSDQDIDARSDIYSLGCVAYEMLAGLPPFVGATPQAVMARRFASPPSPLHDVREGVPEQVDRAIAKALCRAPADRWASAAEFGAALRAPPLSPSIQAAQLKMDSRRRNFARAVLGVVAVGLIVTVIFAWSRANRDYVTRAQVALAEWDLITAESELRRAVARQRHNPAAQLWMAQVLMLRRAPQSEWQPFALRAMDRKAELSDTDRARAEALVAAATGQGPERCAGFKQLAVRRAPGSAGDLTALIPLGDCLRGDQSVVPDNTSPSKYRFAASHHQIAGIYEELLVRNAKNGAAYRLLLPRLEDVLLTSENTLRGGTLRGDPDANFVAWPALVQDTLAYVPYPQSGTGEPIWSETARLKRVVSRNLKRLTDHARAWTEAAPADPDAHELLARMLEAAGTLDGPQGSALQHIEHARNAANPGTLKDGEAYLRRVRLGSNQVRLLLKLNRFSKASLLADSILDWRQGVALDDSVQSEVDQMHVGLAALTGRLRNVLAINEKNAADYQISLPSGERKRLPDDLGSDALRLFTYAAFGSPADSITGISNRLSEKLAGSFPPAQVADVRAAVMRRPLSLAVSSIGANAVVGLGPTADLFINALRALESRNLRLAKRFSDSLSTLYADNAPGEITMDVVLQYAWLRAALGDSAGAARFLENALRGLSRAPPQLLLRVELPTALVRAMIFRAELAARANDEKAASTWIRAANDLWGRGDPEIRSELQRLRPRQ